MTEATSSITRMLLHQLFLFNLRHSSLLRPPTTMPGTGVVDAFKSISFPSSLFVYSFSFLDLIRHGKHHNHHTLKEDPSPSPTASRAVRQQPQAQGHPPYEIPHPREAAEIIVNEEREAKTKMPHYRGLENFKLIEKMGECVEISHSISSSDL